MPEIATPTLHTSVVAVTGTFSGAVSAASYGAVVATTGTFSGLATLSGGVTGAAASDLGTGTRFRDLYLSRNADIVGNVSADNFYTTVAQVSVPNNTSTAVFTPAEGTAWELVLSIDGQVNARAVAIVSSYSPNTAYVGSTLLPSVTGSFLGGVGPTASGASIMAIHTYGTTHDVTVRARRLYKAF